ncbi:MAG: DUF4411 family protein [Oscillospiraceae bacterium]|jgi:predicted nucleic acid-binding protein|nr:DUF4411 family protein [Oscillospiraceae bacterium]
MRIYVVDTNVFSRTLNNLSFKAFEDVIYKPWSDRMNNGTIISVDEVYRELDRLYGANDAKSKRKEQGEWLHTHKFAFQNMTENEAKIVAEIFKSGKFREGVKEKSLRDGTPEADAILVAKAKCVNGIVVTAESSAKPNSEKVPNICISQSVPFIDFDDFHILLRNIVSGKDELDNIKVKYSLEYQG